MTGGHNDPDPDPNGDPDPDRDRASAGAVSAEPETETEPDKKLSDELEEWLSGEGERTLGALVDAFGKKSFAIVFVLLLGVPALPLPTGGATHVFEVIAALLALELIIGRDQVWLPERWQRLKLGGDKQQKFIAGLTRLIRRLERLSRPRLSFLFDHRLSNIVFGLIVLGGSAGAFFAPPFTGLDTLPSLGVVLVALAVLLEDFLIVAAGLIVLVVGVALEIVLGAAAVHGLSSLF